MSKTPSTAPYCTACSSDCIVKNGHNACGSAQLLAGYRCRAMRNDFWLAYDEVFPRRTHRSCGEGAGETCHVERWNNTLRQRLGRFARLPGFSQP